MWRLNDMLLNNQCITEEIKEGEKKKNQETNENENYSNSMKHSKNNSKREAYSSTILPQEIRKISNKQPNLKPKAIWERTTTTKPPQS